MKLKGKRAMSELNKYKDLPDTLLPQLKEQCKQRILALETVITTQTDALELALKNVHVQLDDAKKDLTEVESRISA
ncbi:MAG TPA: hypothetical protein EYG21_06130 [Nitrospinaceae bacterium]|jgi:hypothetical protein|nr:hypothetical protein [Nitrospinaceae bacterium]